METLSLPDYRHEPYKVFSLAVCFFLFYFFACDHMDYPSKLPKQTKYSSSRTVCLASGLSYHPAKIKHCMMGEHGGVQQQGLPMNKEVFIVERSYPSQL